MWSWTWSVRCVVVNILSPVGTENTYRARGKSTGSGKCPPMFQYQRHRAMPHTFPALGHSMLWLCAVQRPIDWQLCFGLRSVVFRRGTLSFERFMKGIIAGSPSLRITSLSGNMALTKCITHAAANSVRLAHRECN